MAGQDDKPRSTRGIFLKDDSTAQGLNRVISGRHLDDQYHGHESYADTKSERDIENEEEDEEEGEGEGGHGEKNSDEADLSRDGSATGEADLEKDQVEDDDAIPGGGVLGAPVDDKDLEAGNLEKSKTSNSKRSKKDPNLVSWKGPDDPENPKNWPLNRKWAATLVVSSFTLISPVSSSMVAPALPTISKQFGITNEVEAQLTLSIFILAYAIGPLFLGPLSEMYGRAIVLQTSNLLYFFFNLGCGLAQSKSQMIIFRFLSGLGGSAPLALGGGVLSDLFAPEQRGKAISVYSLAPLLGPALGPIAGGFITENTTWRWVFYATTITDGLIQAFGLFFLQETYPPVLLERKKKKLIKETGNTALFTEWDNPNRTIIQSLKTALARPFRLLATQIIIQILAIYMAYLYGIMYLVLSTFPTLWTNVYHESIGIGGLNYISLGTGLFIGTQICAPTQDRIYRVLKKRNNGVGKPEFRVPLMVPGAFCVPVGLFWYGWSAEAKLHWIMPNIGVAIFGVGVITGFQCIQTYIVDAYTTFAASAVGSVAVMRSLAGFGFPLFAPYMYDKLHYGWGNSLLGFLAIALGWPAPFLLWKYGELLRKKSTFAAG